jgi:nucleoside 2-deoxyribosyltransferase
MFMGAKTYLAGPDVFFANAALHAAKKVEICARYGLDGLPPHNPDGDQPSGYGGDGAWRLIYEKDISMMEMSDLIIANLTPFGGASADAGTLIEVGWFLGRGKPIFGYSNIAKTFERRMQQHALRSEVDLTDMSIEGFHLPDNLMIVGAVHATGYPIFVPTDSKERGYDALDVFEACVVQASAHLASEKGNLVTTLQQGGKYRR